MPLTYTKSPIVVLRNVFVVAFSFEHGDADETTSYNVEIPLSKTEFENYLTKVNAIAEEIRDARSNGEK